MTALTDRKPHRGVAIALLVCASVYAWYAVTQYARLNDLNQRQLSNVAAELKTSLDDSAETLRQFNDKWKTTGRKALVCDFVRNQPYLELRECTAGATAEVSWDDLPDIRWSTSPTLNLQARGSGSIRSFRYRTDKLLHELPFPDSFALLFVATSNGDVLYQDAPAQHRWLRYLRWGEQQFRDPHAERAPALQVQNLQEMVGGDAAWRKLRGLSSRTRIDLGGTTHELYLQPLVLEDGQAMTLIVGGAVQRSSVIRGALALGTPLVGILVVLVLLTVFGFPFFKLACLDRHERFSLRDIKLVYVSAGALLVLMTCASLALDGYSRWRMEADAGLRPLAVHQERLLINEIAAIRDQLVRYDDLVAKWNWPCEKAVEASWFESRQPDHLPWPDAVNLKTVSWIDSDGLQIWKSTGDPVPGKVRVGHRVYFRAVREDNLFQVDGRGPAFFLTPDRSISDGKFYTFVSMPSALGDRRCAEPKNARTEPLAVVTTGQLLSLEAQPLPAGYGFVVINREGRVLYHSDGRLSLRENLYEELSEGVRVRAMTYAGAEGGFDARYRERQHALYLYPVRLARATSRAPEAGERRIDARNAGFYLVVFRDVSVEQALLAHVFVVGLAGPMTLLLLVFFGGLSLLSIAGRLSGHHWSVWLWPHSGLDHIYVRQTIAFGVLLVAGIGIHVATGSVTPFLITPFAAASMGIAIYWHGAARAGRRTPLSNPRWQRLSVFLVLVCLIVVPSAALFRVAVSQEFAKLIVTESEWMREQAEDRLRAARVREQTDRYAPERIAQLGAVRAQYVSCVPAPFDAPSRRTAVEGPSSRHAAIVPAAAIQEEGGASTSPLAQCGDDQSGRSAKLHPIGFVAGMIGLLHVVDDILPIENDTLVRQHFHAVAETYSPDGTIVRRFRAAGISILGLAVGLALLYWWISWNTNGVFLADLDGAAPPAGSCEVLWSQCTKDEQMVLIQVARELVANPHQRDTVTTLLNRGLLQLAPNLQPYSKEFVTFLHAREAELAATIDDWQEATAARSWRQWRLILGGAVVAIGFFLIATQPSLQSGVVAVATGTTGVLTAGSKLREAIGAWLERKKN